MIFVSWDDCAGLRRREKMALGRRVNRHGRDRSIWILGTPISSVGRSISNEAFDIEDFDIECLCDIDNFYIRYRLSTSNVFDIECHSTRYRS
jgi:hypothetical protein